MMVSNHLDHAMLVDVGRLLIFAGIALIVAGVIFIGAERAGIRLGSLPGDIRIHGRRGSFYFPVVTCIVVSLVFTLISWLFRR